MNNTDMDKRTHITRRSTTKEKQKPSAQQLYNEIRREIIEANNHRFLSYEGVEPDIGSLVTESLDQDKAVEAAAPR
jgi:hypothetical protein